MVGVPIVGCLHEAHVDLGFHALDSEKPGVDGSCCVLMGELRNCVGGYSRSGSEGALMGLVDLLDARDGLVYIKNSVENRTPRLKRLCVFRWRGPI